MQDSPCWICDLQGPGSRSRSRNQSTCRSVPRWAMSADYILRPTPKPHSWLVKTRKMRPNKAAPHDQTRTPQDPRSPKPEPSWSQAGAKPEPTLKEAPRRCRCSSPPRREQEIGRNIRHGRGQWKAPKKKPKKPKSSRCDDGEQGCRGRTSGCFRAEGLKALRTAPLLLKKAFAARVRSTGTAHATKAGSRPQSTQES